MKPAALIFDMDGTLADTSAIWRRAEEQLFHAMGASWDEQLVRQCMGLNARDLAARAHGLLHSDADVTAMQDLMRQRLVEAYDQGTAIPMPGAVEMLRRLHGRVPLAVASGSPLAGIETTIRQLGLQNCIDLMVTSEDVDRGKPHPDVFLHTARLLAVPPEACVVFEDSLAGTQAALAAGMRTIVCPRGQAEEIRRLPVECVSHWDQVAVEMVFGSGDAARIQA